MWRQLRRLEGWTRVLVLGLWTLTLGACDSRPVLQEDQALERQLRKDERHRFRVVVPAGHLVEVLVTPLDDPDLDLVTWVFGPRFRRPLPLDGYPNPPEQTVRWLLAGRETRATYRLEVRTQSGSPGRYRIIASSQPLQSGDRARVAAVRRVAEGLRLEEQARKQDALEIFRSAAATWRLLGDRLEMARTLRRAARNAIGRSLWLEARKDCEPAMAVFHDLTAAQAEGEMLNLCGRVHRRLGENARTKESYERALALAKTNGLSGVEGNAYHNLAVLLSEHGNYEQADAYYRQVLRLHRLRAKTSHVISALISLSVNLLRLGKTEAAREALDEAQLLSRNQPVNLAKVLTWQGWIHNRNGEIPAAVECYQEALELLRTAESRSEKATTLANYGKTLSDTGQYIEAAKLYEEALAIFRDLGETTSSAHVLTNLAQLNNRTGRFRKALVYIEQALDLLPEEDQDTRVHVLSIRAQTERLRGDLGKAAMTMEEVLAAQESFRGFNQRDLRLSYFSELNEYYESYVDILMSLDEQEKSVGYAGQALEVSERTRARSLLDALGKLPASGSKIELDPNRRMLREQLERQDLHLRQLWGSAAAQEEIHKAEQELAGSLLVYERQEADQRLTSPLKAQWSTLPASLREIQSELLDVDSLLLVFSLGQERSFLWAVDQEGLSSFELPHRDQLESQARVVHELIQSGDPNFELSVAHATELGDQLLGPAAHLLGERRLLIVADGALQQVPFAALRLPSAEGGESEPLLVAHEIVFLPSASVALALRRRARQRQPPAKLLAIFADPVLSPADPRLPVVVGEDREVLDSLNLDRLPHSSEEANAILAWAAPRGESLLAQGFAASQAAVMQGQLSDYQMLHFATHGVLDTEHPQLSGVVLSLFDAAGKPLDGILRLHEIHELELAAELVTLSACETALGKEYRGEGGVSLARGFLQAGALHVIVSLWKVDDEATAELMKRFYHGLLARGLPPPAALREAQLSLREDPKWQSPYFWAGFVLQGDGSSR